MLLPLSPLPLKINVSYWLSVFKDHIIWVMDDLVSLNCFFLFYPRVKEEHEIQICQMLID